MSLTKERKTLPPGEHSLKRAEERQREANDRLERTLAYSNSRIIADVLVYVAGPFSGVNRGAVEANIQRAALRGLEVAKLGACPIVPHSNTSLPEYEHVQPYSFWIAATLEMMRRCDALLTVPGWESSSGARGEVNAMTDMGKPVFHDLTNLGDWLNAKARERREG